MKTLNALKFAIERDITLFAFGAPLKDLRNPVLTVFLFSIMAVMP